MNPLLVSIPIVFLAGIAVGFLIGKRKSKTIINLSNKMAKRVEKRLKVLRKSNPKTYKQKVADALDKEKPIIKTFYK